jgi:hypothetical protein
MLQVLHFAFPKRLYESQRPSRPEIRPANPQVTLYRSKEFEKLRRTGVSHRCEVGFADYRNVAVNFCGSTSCPDA